MTTTIAPFEEVADWERALYAFLAEKERRSGSRRTVEGYSRMLQHFFGALARPPHEATSQELFAWTSSGGNGGAVSGNAFAMKGSEIVRVKYIPGIGGDQPSDAYDVTLVDEDSIDLLGGTGSNMSQTTATIAVPAVSTYFWPVVDPSQDVDLVAANAGDTKKGTVEVLVR